MKMTIEYVQQVVYDAIKVAATRYPTKIFMDTASLMEFSKTFKPKERIKLNSNEDESDTKIKSMNFTGAGELKFYEVNTTETIFEVV